MFAPINSEMIKKRAQKLKATQASRRFNAYEYLMKHSEKAFLVNLPINPLDVMHILLINGKKLILLNENARVSIEDLNLGLTAEIAKIELGDHANDENVKMFVKSLLD